ncbi:hypothetical protein DFJ73DRAFT_968435 [Zopfochytrium polystomum]|nr:hypothetical protein DFJ73DRAFT_968435 [Zopfochytrium polystomum]
MAAFLILVPSINASISMLNLIACIAQENATRRRRRAQNDLSSTSSSTPSPSSTSTAAAAPRPLLSLAQKAIAIATVISLVADLVMFYIAVRTSVDRSSPAASARARATPAAPLPPPSSRRSPAAFAAAGFTAAAAPQTSPAVLSTAAYTALGAAAVACQLSAYVANDWSLARSKSSPAFKAYRAFSLVATTYFAAVGLYTDVALVTLTARLFRPDHHHETPPPPTASPFVSSSAHLTLPRPPSSVFTPPPPPPPARTPSSPLTRVKKYYNHALNLAYEIALSLAYVALSVAFFFDPRFHACVFVEQALLAFVAWNGYVLLHVAVREDDDDAGRWLAGSGSAGGADEGSEVCRWKTTGAPAAVMGVAGRVDLVLSGRAAADETSGGGDGKKCSRTFSFIFWYLD